MTPSEMDSLIYLQYPRKIARIAALKAIGKAAAFLAKDQAISEIDARRWLYKATKAYAHSPAGNNPDKTMIPHPATWFNRGSYMDDPQEWQHVKSQERQKPNANDEALARFLERKANSHSTHEYGYKATGTDSRGPRLVRRGSNGLSPVGY